jgi:hypothetical protein
MVSLHGVRTGDKRMCLSGDWAWRSQEAGRTYVLVKLPDCDSITSVAGDMRSCTDCKVAADERAWEAQPTGDGALLRSLCSIHARTHACFVCACVCVCVRACAHAHAQITGVRSGRQAGAVARQHVAVQP